MTSAYMGNTAVSSDCQGNSDSIELEEEEMYGEFFDIPTPESQVFLSWYSGGEVFGQAVPGQEDMEESSISSRDMRQTDLISIHLFGRLSAMR